MRLNLVANSRGDLIVGLGGVQGRGDRRVVVGLVRIVDGGRRRMMGRVGRRPRQGFGGVLTPPARGMGWGGGVLRPMVYGRWELGRMVLVGIVTSAAAPSSRGDIQGRGVLLRRLTATASAGAARQPPRNGAGSVLAVVIDQNDAEIARNNFWSRVETEITLFFLDCAIRPPVIVTSSISLNESGTTCRLPGLASMRPRPRPPNSP